jgi:hypothetical protein
MLSRHSERYDVRDILTPVVPTSLVTVATDGYATSDVLRAWIARDMFETPASLMPEPRAGKPRLFPLLAVYEAAMLSWTAQIGLSLPFMRGVWSWRKRQLAATVASSGWTDDHFIAAIQAGNAPEFEPRLDDKALYWIAGLHSQKEQGARVFGVVAGDQERVSRSMNVLSLVAGGSAVVLNITAFVNAVDKRLSEAGFSPVVV